MAASNQLWTVSFCLILFIWAGCAPPPETATSSTSNDTKSSVSDRAPVFEDEPVAVEMAMEESSGWNGEDLKLNPPEPIAEFQDLKIEKRHFSASPIRPPAVKSAPKMVRTAPAVAPRNPTKRVVEKRSAARRMSVMAPAEVETKLPPSQTTLRVFYATDRKSEFGISSSDWMNVHFSALIALSIYIASFACVFLTRRKVFSGFLALVSLVAFLVLGQSASVNWQKHKRLAENDDARYIAEIRNQTPESVLDYGTCEVTIPPSHKIGHVDSPSLFKLEFREDPEKHVVMHRVIRSDKNEFYSQLKDAIGQSRQNQALVFIHGYNVSFDNAVKRTAQIAHDIKFDGVPICYSWTSHGALANYTRDMANADATVVALQSFLQETVQRTGNTTIHLVAHSMGNRALLQALDRIAVGSTRTTNKMFGQLVMAAPDVSVNDFRTRYVPSAQKLASTMTLYASSKDRALIASTKIHGHNRAGLAGEGMVMLDGMDTIDVSEIDTSLIGHSYYGDHPELIRDLRALVELSQPAANRPWLTRMIHPESFDYFRFAEHETRAAEDSQRESQRR